MRAVCRDVIVALSCYVGTAALVLLALALGAALSGENVSIERVFRSDGVWYRRIVTDNYSYSADRRSNVAFFPLYPMLGRAILGVTGLSAETSLVAVAHGALALCFILLLAYSRAREPKAGPVACGWALVAFGLCPVTFFFRMPYSESVFFALVVLAFLGMRRGWSVFGVAAIIGLSTAARPVGVALVPPLLLHLWNTRSSGPNFLGRSILVVPVALWGLVCYTSYLWWRFGDPLAFAQTQDNWHLVPKVPFGERALSLLALEPFWGYVDPDSPFHWSRDRHGDLGIFSAAIFDRGAVVVWAALTWLGWRKRWLKPEEVLLSVCLVGMAYILRGYEMAFFSMGRFTSVAFPIYLSAGRLLAAAPRVVSVSLLIMNGLLLATYAALFSAGYTFI
jgi:hypothetical protein